MTRKRRDWEDEKHFAWVAFVCTCLLLVFVLAAKCSLAADVQGLGGCPKPLPHHAKHKVDAPLCTCTVEPRTILLPAPTPEPEPIELSVLRYYVPLTADLGYEPQSYGWDMQRNWGMPIGGYAYQGAYVPAAQVKAPEIDASSGIAAVTALVMFILVVTDRRPRS